MTTKKNSDGGLRDVMVGEVKVSNVKLDDPLNILMKMITSGQRLALHAKIQGIDLNELRAEYAATNNKGARMGLINNAISDAIKSAVVSKS